MGQQVVEVVYGKHRIYHVIADRRTFTTDYLVKSTDGSVFASFKWLDVAVQWARAKAAQY
jgi:hypothetical protein